MLTKAPFQTRCTPETVNRRSVGGIVFCSSVDSAVSSLRSAVMRCQQRPPAAERGHRAERRARGESVLRWRYRQLTATSNEAQTKHHGSPRPNGYSTYTRVHRGPGALGGAPLGSAPSRVQCRAVLGAVIVPVGIDSLSHAVCRRCRRFMSGRRRS